MSNYTFYQVGNEYIWSNDKIKLILSKGSFQGRDEYGYTHDEKDILYLYYTVELFAKKHSWSLVSSKPVYDFPGLKTLKNMLYTLLYTEIPLSEYKEFSYITKANDNIKGYELRLQTEGFAFDDVYEIVKTIRKDFDKGETVELYSLYMGCSIDYQGDNASIGIQDKKIEKSDLEELYKMISAFFKDLINKQNAKVIESNKRYINSLRTKENKLYSVDENYCICDVYTKGMCVDIIALNGSLDSKDFSSCCYSNSVIEEIAEDGLQISDAFINKDSKKVVYAFIPYSQIVSIYNNLDNKESEKLSWTIEDIANHFVTLLSDDEKIEFKEKDIEYLMLKWKECLVNRYWMCRSEHNLKQIVEDKGNHENVYANIKEIILRIKELL